MVGVKRFSRTASARRSISAARRSQPSLREAGVGCAEGAKRQLARDERRDAEIPVEQEALDGLLRSPAAAGQLDRPLRVGQQRELVERRRKLIVQPRQQRPRTGNLKLHTAHTIQNAVVLVEQQEVRAAAHRLEHQLLRAGLAQLIHAADGERHDALQSALLDLRDASADEVLAQQHTEHRRLGGILTQDLRELHARLVRPRVEEQAQIAAQEQHDLVARGLLHLVDARAEELPLQFICQCPQADRVKRHRSPPSSG